MVICCIWTSTRKCNKFAKKTVLQNKTVIIKTFLLSFKIRKIKSKILLHTTTEVSLRKMLMHIFPNTLKCYSFVLQRTVLLYLKSFVTPVLITMNDLKANEFPLLIITHF